MSVIVKGIDMPVTCSECPMAYDSMCGGILDIENQFRNWYDEPNIKRGFDLIVTMDDYRSVLW